MSNNCPPPREFLIRILCSRGLTSAVSTEMKSSKRAASWLFRFVLVLLSFQISLAQTPVGTDLEGGVWDGSSVKGRSAYMSPAYPKHGASDADAESGSIIGTVLDPNGSPAASAVVRLTTGDSTFSQEVLSGDNGEFSFANVTPGPFKLSVSAEGFEKQDISGELKSGQVNLLRPIVISIATVVTDVRVTVDPVEVATAEVKEQEQQRVLGVFPNFYVTYIQDAAPLTTKLKFQLAWKSSTDPVTIVGTGILGGMQQAGDQYAEFGQGAEGYAKRFGANYVDVFASTFLSGVVFPSLLKQDPRYYYQGTGSIRSRLLHAIENAVKCKGDNGHWQVNYSNIAGSFAGAALSSTFYPTNNVGTFILSGGAIRLGESSLTGVIQEFVLRKLTKKKSRSANSSGPFAKNSTN